MNHITNKTFHLLSYLSTELTFSITEKKTVTVEHSKIEMSLKKANIKSNFKNVMSKGDFFFLFYWEMKAGKMKPDFSLVEASLYIPNPHFLIMLRVIEIISFDKPVIYCIVRLVILYENIF